MDTNRLVKAIIIVAAIIIFIALLWICYDKFFVKEDRGFNDKAVIIDETKKDTSSPTGDIPEGEVGLNNSTVQELGKIFSTFSDKDENYIKYSNIKKLSSTFGTNEKLYFTFYSLNFDKKYNDINCSEVKVKAPSGWSCGIDSKTTKSFSESTVTDKYKYLFGNSQTIDKQNCDYETNKIIYDSSLKSWIMFYSQNKSQSGEFVKATLDGAYSDQGNLDIVTSETINNNKTNTVTLTFRFDEVENHYVFSKRFVE